MIATPTLKTSRAVSTIDPLAESELQTIAQDVLNGLQYSFLAAAANQSKPFPGVVEEKFRLAIATLKPERKSVYQAKAQDLAAQNAATRQQQFGRYGAMELTDYGQLGYAAATAKLPALQLNGPGLVDIVRRLGLPPLTLAPVAPVSGPGPISSAIHPRSGEAPAPTVTTIGFHISRVTCVDETDPEIGSDEIAIGGMAVDESGNTTKIEPFTVSENFTEDDNPVVAYPYPGKLFCQFDATKASTPFPKNYAAIVFLAELDSGGFASMLTDAWQAAAPAIKQKIEDALTAAGAAWGAIGAVIGKVLGKILGWIVDKLVGWIISWFEDDLFAPGTALVALGTPVGTAYLNSPGWNNLATNEGEFDFQGHGGEYKVDCRWHLNLTGDITSPAAGPASPKHYVGVFRSGTDPYAFWVSDWTRFEAKWHELSNAGLRLVCLETFPDGANRLYAGVFRGGTDGYALWVGDEWDGFKAKWDALSKGGLRLISMRTYFEGTKRLYTGVFRAGSDGYALWAGLDWATFVAKWKDASASGLRLIDISSYFEGGKQLFNGVYRAGTDGYALWSSDWAGFTAEWKNLSQGGLRLIDIDTYVENGKRIFVGVYRAGTDGYFLWDGDWNSFVQKWSEAGKGGLRLLSVATY